jgi:hypothetical protein
MSIYTVNTMQIEFNSIIADRENWEINELAESNKRLYAILARCYAIFVDHKETDEGRKLINDTAVAMDVSFNDVTSTAAKVIKIIFGDDNRHKASDYAKVLKIASAAEVSKANFETWLSTKGGIYAVRRGNAPSAEQKKAEQDNAYNSGITKLEQLGAAASVPPHVNVSARNGYVLAVCYVDAYGALSVIKTVGDANSDQVKAEIRRIGNEAIKSAKSNTNAPAPSAPVTTDFAAASAKAQSDALAAAIAAGTDLNQSSTTQQQIAA